MTAEPSSDDTVLHARDARGTINIDGARAMATPHYALVARGTPSPVYDGFQLAVPPKLLQQAAK